MNQLNQIRRELNTPLDTIRRGLNKDISKKVSQLAATTHEPRVKDMVQNESSRDVLADIIDWVEA